jgi:hypothetical protein
MAEYKDDEQALTIQAQMSPPDATDFSHPFCSQSRHGIKVKHRGVNLPLGGIQCGWTERSCA